MKRQVIVVGAGPGGSTAAYYLAKLGVDVLLLDKETWPRDKPCGDSYLTSLYPLFEEMGIMEEMQANVSMVPTIMRLIDSKEECYDFDLQPWMIVPRRIGDDIIRRAALKAGADFMENFDVTELIMRKGVVKGIRGYYQNREMTIECDAVVVANGSHSMLSRQLGGFVEDKELVNYCWRGYYKGVEGMVHGRVEEIYFPDSLPNPTHGPLCMAWVSPLYEEGSGYASCGMTIPERVLNEADMTLEEMWNFWCTQTVQGRLHMQHAEPLDEMRCMRLPSSKKLQKSYAAGAIMIGDAANAAECAYDYGIPSAMYGGKIAAEVLKECLDRGDVSEEALKEYQVRAEANLNDGLMFNGIFRDMLLLKKDEMDRYLHWAKNLPDYPHIYFDQTAMKYLVEVLGLTPPSSDKKISQ
ncbi:MAG: NAD(P)/FAD-dependent oxidoreductase [Lachnospiraceae bacterium]|nr:NAD(P)/FAD-dependent oxidoreductase [Lachnospiraceae bacterium]